MSRTPIGDYALLSDCNSAALVSKAGSIDWLCWPRFDSPAVFARILDRDGGHWSIAPSHDSQVTRRYLERTLVLETKFHAPTGVVTIVDAMATGENPGHELGKRAPRVLLRWLHCDEGEVELGIEFGPVPEYGLVYPMLERRDGGIGARAGADVLTFSSPVDLEIGRTEATGRVRVRAGEELGFALQHRSSWEQRPRFFDQAEIRSMLEETSGAWRNWSKEHQNYDGPWRELVYHSGTVLQGLTYQPTGAIVAAPTTSLPEDVGGMRNWDYRYSWVRDASFTLEALWVAACPDEAAEFFRWMAGATAAQLEIGSELQIMFGVGGEHDLSERELPHLEGWMESKPVRVGNGAWTQRQIDAYGELLGAAHRLVDTLGELDEGTRRFLVNVADAAARNWKRQGHGIWEIRGEPKDYLHAKVMCWVALDRAISLADHFDAADKVEAWRETRDEIRATILERGWSEKAQSFAQSYDSDVLDASVLTMPIVGFIDANDPKMRSTLDAVERELSDDRGLLYRYRAHDGLSGDEGTFLLCTFWLAHALALAGEVTHGREVIERATGYANDVGLLSEEIDPKTGQLLGNFPQAFSHIGLVNAAWAISEAERR